MHHQRFAPLVSARLVCVAMVALAGAACSSSFSTDASIPTQFNADDGGAASTDAAPGPAYDAVSDAGATLSLCGDPTNECVPDESASDKALVQSCPVPPAGPDGGAYADGGAPVSACRLTSKSGQHAVALCALSGAGKDGDACASGSDCSAGFECVSSPGRCRHYCCDPTECKTLGVGAPTDATFFCDVQTQSSSNLKVPVCLPMQACKLLGTTCGPDQTCSIVDVPGGLTSCVQIGPAKVGESCETTHCGPNLVCLGTAGKRSCQQLCDPSQASSCPVNQQCKQPWPVLKMESAGICQ